MILPGDAKLGEVRGRRAKGKKFNEDVGCVLLHISNGTHCLGHGGLLCISMGGRLEAGNVLAGSGCAYGVRNILIPPLTEPARAVQLGATKGLSSGEN
jgi:hypothetical protein